jgi:hypothetical protein
MRRTISHLALLAFAGAAPAPAAVSDFTFATSFSASDSVGIKAWDAECPAGTFPIGGGAWVGGHRLQRGLVASETLYDAGSGDPIGWSARAREVATDSEQWNLAVRAVCGNAPGLERVGDETQGDSVSPKFVLVECPPGKAPLSGGFAIGGSVFGPVVFESRPALDPDTREAYGWMVSAREAEPTDAIWSLRAEVTCADVEIVVQNVVDESAIGLSYRDLIHVCPARTVATGGGVNITGPPVEWIAASYLESSTSWQVGVTRMTGNPNLTRLDSYAVCPEPGATLSCVAALGVLARAARRREIRLSA